jgi:hypothetical protein
MGRFEAVDGNGICLVADLKEKGMGRSLEDLKGTGVRGSKGRMGGGARTKTIGEVSRSTGKEGGEEGVREEGVRVPERAVWSVVRKVEEVSSGEAGNWDGRMRGVPKTASAGERLVSSWGMDRKDRRNQGG